LRDCRCRIPGLETLLRVTWNREKMLESTDRGVYVLDTAIRGHKLAGQCRMDWRRNCDIVFLIM
jgi:hypothetical protein